jgi:hypothetical protein
MLALPAPGRGAHETEPRSRWSSLRFHSGTRSARLGRHSSPRDRLLLEVFDASERPGNRRATAQNQGRFARASTAASSASTPSSTIRPTARTTSSIYLSPYVSVHGVFGVAAGVWTVRLAGVEIKDGRYHAWIERDDPRPVGRRGRQGAVELPTTPRSRRPAADSRSSRWPTWTSSTSGSTSRAARGRRGTAGTSPMWRRPARGSSPRKASPAAMIDGRR